jgi:hypothetical protein
MRGSTLGRVAALCATLWVPIAIGCGDDDDGGANKDAGTSGSGASGSGSGASGNGGSGSTITPLGDDVAGDACTGSSDCGGAMCATQVPGATMILQADAPGGYCTGPCMTDAQCGQGGACVGALAGLTGQCFARCMSDDDCRDEYVCTMQQTLLGVTIPSTCRPKPATVQLGDDVAGKACTSADDCGGGMCAMMRGIMGVASTPLPGGYCTGDCTEDAHCGGNGVCSPPLLPVQGLTGACYQACTSDSDCDREGYRCRDIGQGKRGCDPFPDPLPDGNAGKMCSTDADCGGVMGTCRTALPTGAGFGNNSSQPAPDGYCSQVCAEDADCGTGGVCVGIINAACFKTCASQTDCRTGYVCEMRGGGAFPGQPMTPPDMVCAPADPEPPPDAGMMTPDAGMPDAAGP